MTPGGLRQTVFERLPFGVLVTQTDGVVIDANPEAGRVFGRDDLAGRTCCVLLGCGLPDGPPGDACITARALAGGRTLPEARVDVVQGDAPVALWVTASPLGEGRVLLHLRPGLAGDRRRRSDPTWDAGPLLHLRVLGRTSVRTPEGPLDGPWLRQRPGLLLKLLVSNRRRVTHTDELATAFWPGADRRAMQNVRYCVHELRGRLEPDRAPRAPSAFVTGHDGGYGIDPARVRVDADEFERSVRAGLAARAAGEHEAAIAALARAASLYQGDFLADEPYAEWALAERDRLHELACRTLDALCGLERQAGDADAAIGHLQRLAELEPLDEAIQRRLISELLELGRSGEALRRYKQAQAARQAAFGEDLSFDLASLRASRQESA